MPPLKDEYEAARDEAIKDRSNDQLWDEVSILRRYLEKALERIDALETVVKKDV